MTINPLATLAALVGGLLLAGLLGWVRKPRISVVVQRQFTHSQITDHGQLVEISVFNRSLKTEESIEVTLSHTLKYQMLGANNQDVILDNNKVKIPRIGPSDDVTVLLIVEGGPFTKSDIVQCLSKETKGTIASKLEEVPLAGPQRITAIALLVGFPALIYATTTGIDYLFNQSKSAAASAASAASSASVSATAALSARSYREIQGWKVPSFYESSSQIFSDFVTKKLLVTLGTPVRKGDFVSVPVQFKNGTSAVLNATLNMTSARSLEKIKSYDLMTDRILIVPGKSQEQAIRVFIPQNSVELTDRVVYVDVFIQSNDSDSLSMNTQLDVR